MFAMRRARIVVPDAYEDSGNRIHWCTGNRAPSPNALAPFRRRELHLCSCQRSLHLCRMNMPFFRAVSSRGGLGGPKRARPERARPSICAPALPPGASELAAVKRMRQTFANEQVSYIFPVTLE